MPGAHNGLSTGQCWALPTCPEILSPWSPRRWLCFLQPPQDWATQDLRVPLPTAVPWRQRSADQRPHYGGAAGAGHTLPGGAFFPGPLNRARLMPLLWAASQPCSCTCPLQARGGRLGVEDGGGGREELPITAFRCRPQTNLSLLPSGLFQKHPHLSRTLGGCWP